MLPHPVASPGKCPVLCFSLPCGWEDAEAVRSQSSVVFKLSIGFPDYYCFWPQYPVLYRITSEKHVVKCCPCSAKAGSEAGSLCSDESRAINAVKQIGTERMLFSNM